MQIKFRNEKIKLYEEGWKEEEAEWVSKIVERNYFR